MRLPLSSRTIEALAAVISGGSANTIDAPIGLYRQGWKIEAFMRACGVEMSVGNGSRVSSLISALSEIQSRSDAAKVMQKVFETAADPGDFIDTPGRHDQVLDYLNRYLAFEDLRLDAHGRRVRLVEIRDAVQFVEAFAAAAEAVDFDTVNRDLDRALASVLADPEDAVTAACSVVESVCRSILVELDLSLPEKKDIQSLYRAVREPLGISPDRSDFPEEIATDIRTILGGLNATVQGIGALRTHAGDAHGRERGYRRIDARIARLAIHSASTVAHFLIETWVLKFPDRPLHTA